MGTFGHGVMVNSLRKLLKKSANKTAGERKPEA